MSLVPLVGEGFWVPRLHPIVSTEFMSVSNSAVLDADEEEFQMLGNLRLQGGLAGGSKTFGPSGSALGWLPGTTTFAAGATVRLGVKLATAFDLANGPPGRATIGPAAFAVYGELVGGTHTITGGTWRADAMSTGTPVVLSQGAPLAICWHLNVTGGSPSVIVRMVVPTSRRLWPAMTNVTSGPTYTSQLGVPLAILTFEDGTIGWLDPTYPQAVTDAVTPVIGAGNILANIVRLNYPVVIDALMAAVQVVNAASDFALEVYAAPLTGSPTLLVSQSFDAHLASETGLPRLLTREFAAPIMLLPNTEYAIGLKQLTTNGVSTTRREVASATHFLTGGLGGECYAADASGSGPFVQQASGLRRYHIWARISALDNGRRTRARAFTGF